MPDAVAGALIAEEKLVHQMRWFSRLRLPTRRIARDICRTVCCPMSLDGFDFQDSRWPAVGHIHQPGFDTCHRYARRPG